MLKVLTLNLGGVLGSWRERRAEVLAWLTILEPDIVCFQEVIEDAQGRNTARWIAEHSPVGWSVAYEGLPVPASMFLENPPADVTTGDAILSRWPIEVQYQQPLLTHEKSPFKCAVLHAQTNGLDIFNTHLEPNPSLGVVRRAQVVELVSIVRTRASDQSPLPPILCGDFNARPDTDEIRFLAGLTSIDGESTFFQDAWQCAGGGSGGYTWDNRNPHAWSHFIHDQRIDYVFVGNNFGRGQHLDSLGRPMGDGTGRVESARVVCDRALTGMMASDHYGVFVEVAWPGRPPGGAIRDRRTGVD